jgi:hypothetical protein
MFAALVTNLALIAARIGSAAGLAALLASKLLPKIDAKAPHPEAPTRATDPEEECR